MLAFVVRELSYLKVLFPIILSIKNRGIKYSIYYYDVPHGSKEYDRPTLNKLKETAGELMGGGCGLSAFTSEKQLRKHLIQDKIKKLVSLEIWLWAGKYINFFSENGIKLYSVMYLTDSMWQPDAKCITSMHRVYYSSEHIMKMHHKFSNIMFDPVRDKSFGSPIFDPISKNSTGKEVLVLLPNVSREDARKAFGSHDNLINIIKKICEFQKPIFKARRKQWVPDVVRNMGSVVYDRFPVYPPVMSDLLSQSFVTVMFCSSGIYECVYGNNYIYNIEVPISRWSWDKKKMQDYFSLQGNTLYNFPGVVETISQKKVLAGGWKFAPQKIDSVSRDRWVNKFIGADINRAASIAGDILL